MEFTPTIIAYLKNGSTKSCSSKHYLSDDVLVKLIRANMLDYLFR